MLADYLRRISASKRTPPIALAIALLSFACVVTVDSVSAYELRLSSYYLLIILAVGWFCGVSWAALFAVLSMFVEVQIGRQAGYPLADSLYFYVSIGNRLFAYLLVALLVSIIRTLYDREISMARVDYLTGIANAKGFNEQLANEVARHRRNRSPFSVAYIDCDNFKTVNDTHGHAAGDKLLQLVAATCQSNLRRTDVVARLGGDEFAVVLPQSGEFAALQAINKLSKQLAMVIAENESSVTLSIGVGIFLQPPESVEQIVSFSDQLMYRVKSTGKNKILHRVYDSGKAGASPPARLMVG
jgi:diguanylate cyclase (GGDEF)-like protein